MSLPVTVILVYSTSYALRAEKALLGAGIACKLIPVPRHLSSDCGVCVQIERSCRRAAQLCLAQGRVEVDSYQDVD